MPPSRVRIFFEIASSPEVVRRALIVACIVGLILNLINQGEHLIAFRFASVNWLKFGVTFIVPFCVSAYSAAQIKMSLIPGNRAYSDLQLSCARCNVNSTTVPKESLIPDCPKCKQRTKWKSQTVVTR